MISRATPSQQCKDPTSLLHPLKSELCEQAVYALSCARRVELAHDIDTRDLYKQLTSSQWLDVYKCLDDKTLQ